VTAGEAGKKKRRLTRTQRRAETAWSKVLAVRDRGRRGEPADYKVLAKRFPALLHGSGLCQAVAFVQKKAQDKAVFRTYLEDLAAVMGLDDRAALEEKSRRAPLGSYLRLSREALEAATWLSRYSEALLPDDSAGSGGGDGP